MIRSDTMRNLKYYFAGNVFIIALPTFVLCRTLARTDMTRIQYNNYARDKTIVYTVNALH